mgnify:CR=1 FL=1
MFFSRDRQSVSGARRNLQRHLAKWSLKGRCPDLTGYIACVEFLIPGSEVARRLNIDRSAVSRATRRAGEDPELSGASAKIVEQIRRRKLKHCNNVMRLEN